MNYMSQGSGRMYMSQSNLEMVASQAPAAIYSAVAVNSGFVSVFYGSEVSSSKSLDLINYSDSGGVYSSGSLQLLSGQNQQFGINEGYFSSIMGTYGANPNSVWAKHSSLDLMSSVVSSPLTHIEIDFHPAQFIRALAGGVFVAGASEIQSEIQETFEKLMGEEFPMDIKISVLSAAKFGKIWQNLQKFGKNY